VKKTHIWGIGGLIAGLIVGKMGGIANALGRF